MENFARDLRYALRTLFKNPGFTAVAVITLALGIGVNTSIFSLYNALVLKPLPVKDPGRVVRLFQTHAHELGASVFSYPGYVDYRDNDSVFAGLAAWAWAGAAMGTPDHSEDVRVMLVSGNYFDILGAELAAGRAFVPEEDRSPGAHPVAVLGYRFWQRRFAGNPAIVGRTIRLNGVAFTVVGAAARSFVGTDALEPEIWLPIMMKAVIGQEPDARIFQDRNGHWLQLVGRLKTGVSWANAQASMDVLSRQLAEHYREDKNAGVMLASATFMPPNVEKVATPAAFLTMGAVGLVLLIACANVANLLLSRAAARQKEIGVRLALGATRGRLMRQLLTENVMVALLGGALGLLLAAWFSAGLLRVLTPPFTEDLNFNVSPDLRVLGYALFVSVATVFIFGLVPAWHGSKLGLNDLIKAAIQPRTRTWASDVFVMAQVGLCAVLLVAAGLLLRALERAQTVDPGFDTKHVLALSLDLRMQHYDAAAALAFERRVADRLRSAPGVREVSLAAIVPLGEASMATGIAIEGQEPKPDAPPAIVSQNVVSPEFFKSLGIPVVYGRGFQETDWTPGPEIALINETMARRFWPGQTATGKRFRVGASKAYAEVVGVVKDTRSTYLWQSDEPCIYQPAKTSGNAGPEMKILVRAAADARALMGVLPKLVHEVDRNVPASSKALEENLKLWIWPSQAGAVLAASFGLLALALSAVGIYGVVAYAVSRRTRDIGVHIALGAQRQDVIRLVLGHGMAVVTAGLGAGIAGGFAISRLLAGFLYGLSPGDPVTFTAVAVTLALVALAANVIPVRRAMRIDPVRALHYE